jgi:hypothetical protein
MSAHTLIPPPPWGILFTMVDIRKPLAHTLHCLPSARESWNRDLSMKGTILWRASGHRRWAFANWSRLRCQTVVTSRPWWGWRAHRWTSLRQFLTVSAEILRMCKPTVSSAVRVAGLRQSRSILNSVWNTIKCGKVKGCEYRQCICCVHALNS